MKPIQLLALICAALLAASPASAHGDEEHGEPASSSSPSVEMSQSGASSHSDQMGIEMGQPNSGHDEASGGHDEASGGFFDVLKKLHPATVHFPIALFLMAALTELLLIARPTADVRGAVRIMIYGGAAGAVVAALFGWIHTGLWFSGDAGMQIHRWNGTALAIAGVALAAIARGANENRGLLRGLLFVIAAALLVQGFLGGELAHGPNHLGM